MDSNWKVLQSDDETALKISLSTGLGLLTSRILCARGYDTTQKVNAFLSHNENCNYSPYLMKDMDKAVERIKRAISSKERVCIYGDYDVDGVTSTTVLYLYLTSAGVPCTYFIPGRLEDGYGLNKRVIESFKGKVDLIITVDTGITAVSETEYASSIGIDMVITDHHSCRDVLPEACAVVDPHRDDCPYPFKQLAGVGVVYKLLSALCGDSQSILNQYGDIIAIGTIADVMPIIEENRYITAYGIEKLRHTANIGLRALMEKSGMFGKPGDKQRINSTSVGFMLAPRINAAGRIRNAKIAVDLLLAAGPSQADELAEELCDINKERQRMELQIYEQAVKQVESLGERSVYVLGSDGWHQGVIGVVASRLAERYSRPSILLSFDGEVGKGSGRSIKGFSMLEALSACADLLDEYGGHELAAGLTLRRDTLERFSDRINSFAAECIAANTAHKSVTVDAEISASDITVKQAEELLRLEPFGLQNAEPLLLLPNAEIADIQPLSAGKHIKLMLKSAGKVISAVYFGMRFSEFAYRVGDACNFLCTLEVNEYRGIKEAKLFIKKVVFSSRPECDSNKQAAYYRAAVEDGNCDALPLSAFPTLLQFRAMFRLLKRETCGEKRNFSLCYLQKLIKESNYGLEISLCALHIMFDVLAECGLASCEYTSDGAVVSVKLLPFEGKVNLDRSPLLLKIKQNHRFY